MPRTLIFLALSAAMTGFPLPSLASDFGGCREPLFNTDRPAIIAACTSELAASPDQSRRFDILITRGRAYIVTGRNDEAARDLEAASALKPDDPDPLVRLGWVAFAQKDYQRVGAVIEKVLKLKPDNADAYDLLGSAAGSTGDLRLAKAAFDKAVDIAPKRVLPRYHRFQFYRNTRHYPEALNELDALLKLDLPELDTAFDTIRHREMSYRTMARLERTNMLVAMGRTDEALKAYDEWVKVEPGPVSYTWRGWYRFNQEQFDLASADLKQATSYDPAYWLPYNLQGWVSAYSRQYDAAVPLFSAAIEREPHAGTAYWGRAIALRETKHTDEAIKDAVKAFAVDHAFFEGKVSTLTKLGYLVPPKDGGDRTSAINDAAQACMLDEKCW